MRRLASTVCVLTAGADGRWRGMTVTAVMSLSAEPPTLVVAVNRSASTNGLLQEGAAFAVNLLAEAQEPLASRFAGAAPPETRFDGLDWAEDPWGAPYALGGPASISCLVGRRLEHATHSLIIGDVRQVRLADGLSPLVYANGAFTGLRRTDAASST
jgi:flavin reductase